MTLSCSLNTLSKGDIMAMDRAYIDYAKFPSKLTGAA